ncbi:hypothetical protein C8F01DRAFT_196757 [Mycena amicta]|nr:hypothetical protein C8F01DRAFT_196757 [Mycena amicta]
MHRCLCITEILDNIFDQIKDDVPFASGSRRHHLALLARTCKTFSESALNGVWSELYGLYPFLRLLPPEAIEAGVSPRSPFVRLLRPLKHEDWTVALKHTSRVHHLNLYSNENPGHLKAIAESFPVRPVFPQLRTLDWYQNPPLYWHSFMKPNLEKLSITYLSPLSDWDLADVHAAAVTFSDLRELRLALCLDDPRRDSVCAILTSHIPRLRTFDSASIDETTLHQVVTVSTIESVTVWRCDEWKIPRTFTTRPSLSLHTLCLYDTTFGVVADLLECAPVWALRKLTIDVDALTTHEATRRLFTVLSSRLQADRLETLSVANLDARTVEEVPDKRSVDDYVVHGRILRILFCFPNLSSVVLISSAGFDLDDETLEELTYVWPRLTTLKICSKTDVQLRPRTTGEALLAFARNCRFLQTLALPFDMSRSHIPSFDAQLVQSTLHSLDVCIVSPIEDPVQVAQFLSDLFPRLVEISATAGWKTNLRRGHPLFEESKQERAWIEAWDQVKDILSA